MLYAALLAVAEGQPDAANIGDFHEVFAEARKALNAQRREMGAAVADSDMTEDRSVDADADPARLLLAAFEQQEAAQRHDERARFLELLTDPQRTALLLNAAGIPRREIAERMKVGEETVKTHIATGRKHVANWTETGKLPRGKKL
jgi:DNA-directed RNA polymerase specialized sigma24 family protein